MPSPHPTTFPRPIFLFCLKQRVLSSPPPICCELTLLFLYLGPVCFHFWPTNNFFVAWKYEVRSKHFVLEVRYLCWGGPSLHGQRCHPLTPWACLVYPPDLAQHCKIWCALWFFLPLLQFLSDVSRASALKEFSLTLPWVASTVSILLMIVLYSCLLPFIPLDCFWEVGFVDI